MVSESLARSFLNYQFICSDPYYRRQSVANFFEFFSQLLWQGGTDKPPADSQDEIQITELVPEVTSLYCLFVCFLNFFCW